MSFPKEIVADITKLWRLRPSDGLSLESRFYRSGELGQPPSSFISSYQIRRIGNSVQHDRYLGHTTAQVYEIHFKSILPSEAWTLVDERHLKDGFRVDCMASWQRSVYERRRQNKKFAELIDHPIVKYIRDIRESTRDEFKDYYQTLASYILHDGDWSQEQFAHYASEHKKSSLGGHSWKSFYTTSDDGIILTEKGMGAYRYFNKVVRALCLLMLKDSSYALDGLFENQVIDPFYLYPALRSRPGSTTRTPREVLLSSRAKVTKYRDRNAAGMWGPSQLAWPIFSEDMKSGMYKRLYAIANKTFGHAGPVCTPETHKKKFYTRLKDDRYTYYDTSNAEKLEGALFKLPFRSCFSELSYPAELGDAKVSGGMDTRIGGEWAESAMRLAIVDCGYAEKDNDMLRGGDNIATRTWIDIKTLDDLGLFAPSGRMLGTSSIGETGVRVTRDGADMHYAIRKGKGYVATNQAVPLSSITKSLMSLGLTSVKFWDWYERGTEEAPTTAYEAGGPFSRDDWYQYMNETGRGMLLMALTDLNEDYDLLNRAFKQGVKLIDDLSHERNAQYSYTMNILY
jgi:hypothetical protein